MRPRTSNLNHPLAMGHLLKKQTQFRVAQMHTNTVRVGSVRYANTMQILWYNFFCSRRNGEPRQRSCPMPELYAPARSFGSRFTPSIQLSPSHRAHESFWVTCIVSGSALRDLSNHIASNGRLLFQYALPSKPRAQPESAHTGRS